MRTASKPKRAPAIRVRDELGVRDRAAELARDLRAGFSGERKELPPKYFYDARGSELFERITTLPEYYLTGAETEILRRAAPTIVAELDPRVLVEYGSGSSTKTRLLLDAMCARGRLEGYAPVDVSEESLRAAAASLVADYPGLEVEIVIADFDAPIRLGFDGRTRLVAFLGSTIGNFTPDRARRFLRSVGDQLDPADGFLIGFDLVKDVARLEAAYNDSAGVTAAFNLNLLRILNREVAADFDVEAFEHRAFYDEERARIELHIVSRRRQMVRIGALEMTAAFEEGESIRTELSHKYTRESVERLLASAGLDLVRWETDSGERFAVAVARADGSARGEG